MTVYNTVKFLVFFCAAFMQVACTSGNDHRARGDRRIPQVLTVSEELYTFTADAAQAWCDAGAKCLDIVISDEDPDVRIAEPNPGHWATAGEWDIRVGEGNESFHMLLHEIGHLLGCGHTDEPGHTMSTALYMQPGVITEFDISCATRR